MTPDVSAYKSMLASGSLPDADFGSVMDMIDRMSADPENTMYGLGFPSLPPGLPREDLSRVTKSVLTDDFFDTVASAGAPGFDTSVDAEMEDQDQRHMMAIAKKCGVTYDEVAAAKDEYYGGGNTEPYEAIMSMYYNS